MKIRLAVACAILAFSIPATLSASMNEDVPAALGHASATSDLAGNAAGDADRTHPAIPVVESLHRSLLEIMKAASELGYDGRREALVPVLESSFDLEFMAKKSIGRSWKKLAKEEQSRWVDTFERLTCANYAGRFQGHSGQTFETRQITPASRDTMMVQTTLLNPAGDDVELNYRLIETERGWRIIDVYLDGTVSELALRRAEYSAVLKRNGFEKLLEDVDRRVAELGSVD